MIYTEEFSKSVIYKMMSAFAYNQILVDKDNKPIDYRFLDVNPAFEEMTGMKRTEIIGKTLLEMMPEIAHDHVNWVEVFGKVGLTGEPVSFINNSEALGRWYKINAYSPAANHVVVIFNDISSFKKQELVLTEQKNQLETVIVSIKEREADLREKNEEIVMLNEELTASEEELHSQVDTLLEKENELRHMAFFDPLTSLENRNAFFQRLESLVSQNEISQEKFAVIYLDMDDFKMVNDTMGHKYGDSVLIEVAKRLSAHMTKSDNVARMAGDEFAMALCNIKDDKSVLKRANAIKADLEKPIVLDDLTFHITASMGIAIFPKDGLTVQDLMMNADTAMYKGKERAKNDVSFYLPSMKAETLRRNNLENLLRKAIENNNFKLYFQPQYNIQTRMLRGFEALIRWESPETGMISPMYFIPVAEETGLINRIGDWVLEESCRMCQEWKKQFGCHGIMSVNISPVQLRNPRFTDKVREVVKTYGMQGYLELEITESVFIGQFQPVVDVLKTLKNEGVLISLDDFGTGYSSLNYLRSLPLNTLKIDRSFIANLGKDSIENHIAESIISMVHKIGFETVAEGVEKPEQLQLLEGMGCNMVQGYLTGKPVPQEEVPGIILRKFY